MTGSSPIPSFPDSLVLPAVTSNMPFPHTKDIHAHQHMPSSIQDIYYYSQLSANANHLLTHFSQKTNEIQHLLKKNCEMQMALNQANFRVAELKFASKTPL